MMDAVALLRSMLEIESLSGREGELSAFLVAWMGDHGLAAAVDEVGNAIGSRERPSLDESPISREIVLLGHMDTVPGHVPVRAEGELLYGRGAVDAKGPLAACLVAAATVDLPPGTRVVVIGAVEEEAATSRGAWHIVSRYRPSACVIAEPSGWDAVTLGYKGRLLVDYQLSRPVAHTAGPQTSVAETAVDWWQAVRAQANTYNQERERLFDQLLPSLREISTSTDGLADHVRATVGLRLPPDFDTETLQSTLERVAGDASICCYAGTPAYAASRDTPLVRSFQGAIRQQGSRPRFKLKTGTSDMNVVGPLWQCPVVAYGPGDSTLDHTPQEHIVLPEYLRAIEVLKDVLTSAWT
jgi:[amino group carrier protein]-lysine/ornithine hydrolase